jgi:transcriptional antiterminator NusG
MEMHWYAVQVFSSMEKSVKVALEERIGRSDIQDHFGEI